MSTDKEIFYWSNDAEKRYCSTPYNNLIPKIIFIYAVERQFFDHNRKKKFDSKIGLWPLSEQNASRKSSRTRPAGAMERNPMKATKETFIKIFQLTVFSGNVKKLACS